MRLLLWMFVVTFGVVGCQTVATGFDKPARITDPTDDSRAALQQTVNAVLNTNVTLADDALTDSSLLIVERSMPKSMDGSPAQGRTMEMPYQFRLVINGDECILIDQRDESRHVLQDTSCIAAE